MYTFTVTRTSGSGAARVNYAVTGAQADDFIGGAFPSGTIFFRNGETSITISIPVAGDMLAEPDETFTVALSNPVGGTIATGTATSTIHDFAIQRVGVVGVPGSGPLIEDRSFAPAISGDGRYIAFSSFAPLVAGDTNGWPDVFVFDCQLGTTTRASVDSAGGQANNFSIMPAISADGRYVAFSSAGNLDPRDGNQALDIYMRDLQLGTTTLVSTDSSGNVGFNGSVFPSISANGRYVAFESGSNLVAGDTNGVSDVFVRDLQLGTTTRVSVDSAGSEANHRSSGSSISADGRYVAFVSSADNLVASDTNGQDDVFVRDLQLGTTTRISVDSAGGEANGGSGFFDFPEISGDGRCRLLIRCHEPCRGRHEWQLGCFRARSRARHDDPSQHPRGRQRFERR
ncbi:hypothetical protein J2Z31_001766 [Sinorhizobium kostiense]|uniref:Calx-beta domain-containing protein n=1 Tax=Sinorhizobium kostiense TaxID=76747 RepID=A0ABS4QYW9_9HYPH|nr:Calx-beta domain-containing protein [Sinorhizobium kostiense]MBP2235274.1 hypothetical protein [Sinorhizobium kostiense]